MALALRLAERGMYTTQPNPRVGCVLAHGDNIVGQAWHERAGQAHAEVFALREASARARGACAYVTLEPCAHFGRTPPCADALIEAGVTRVVVASGDPNPKVDGGGLRRLREAGIAVETGLMHDAARELNRGFFSRIERGRPWLRIKLAMSLDGRTALANGKSAWISGEAARADVHRWRARSSAILTGSGTVRADNPRLTVRFDSHSPDYVGGEGWGEGAAHAAASRRGERLPLTQPARPSELGGEGFRPLRVVLDRNLRTPPIARVLDGSTPTLVFHAHGAKPGHDGFDRVECAAVESDSNGLNLLNVLRELSARGVNELQVEAGPTLCGALFAAELVDELLLYVAPVLLGDQARALLRLPGIDDMANARRLRVIEQRQVGDDWRILLRP
ncbi:MAG: bifunctional diaminohydroxyphosphoribosylaminopyrimidine deaminase/5-amino-6-(5-phosphoribosylamino)uracil reductase RibD [Rudaea sp.]